jgi:hypothetical protein
MNKLVLYCKSYRNDLLRLERLAHSVQQFNVDSIPFYVSVPEQDFSLFEEKLSGLNVNLIKDEHILRANPSLDVCKILELPGRLSQQIVKSEFWRLNISTTYVCLDSDCVFIRPFDFGDFISPDNHPYTVMHEAKEFLQFAINHNLENAYDNYHCLRAELMKIFGRTGRHFDFGPVPVIWNSQVWSSLNDQFLQPQNLNFYDAILLFPSEILWYGEAMLRFRPFPIIPIEPIFKVYHSELQYISGQQNGDTVERLAKNFLGVCFQSNWQKGFDLEKKPLTSRAARWIRRKVFRRYG